MKMVVAVMLVGAMFASQQVGAQGAPVTRAVDTAVATATLSDSGIVVRFPRSMSPDSITREMPVLDLFSGYEWRVVLVSGENALVSALVLAPNDSLVVHRVTSIAKLYMAGDLRSCHRNLIVIECDRLARGLVRDVDGRVEIALIDNNWLVMAMRSPNPVMRLVVKRNRDILWTEDIVLIRHESDGSAGAAKATLIPTERASAPRSIVREARECANVEIEVASATPAEPRL